MRKGTLFDSPKYKQFIADRDKALEIVHLNAQTDLSRITFDLLDRVAKEISHLLLYAEPHSAIALADSFDRESVALFSASLPLFVDRIKAMRRAVYLISYAGEMEAIGRATKKTATIHPQDFKKKMHDAVNADTLSGNNLRITVWHFLQSLRGRILKQLRSALIQELPPKEIMDKVKTAFPEIQLYKRPPRKLKPLQESDQKLQETKEVIDASFAPDEDWQLAVDAYTSTELPASRFDQEKPSDDYFAKYNWELEQELTDDFVNQVRDGSNEAAKDLGIKDSVWVAIIDAKTCEVCCLPRNGHTTTEIEQMLSSGDLDAAACDATNPPAHNFCRCQSAPVASTDEVEGPDWKSFNDWLEAA